MISASDVQGSTKLSLENVLILWCAHNIWCYFCQCLIANNEELLPWLRPQAKAISVRERILRTPTFVDTEMFVAYVKRMHTLNTP